MSPDDVHRIERELGFELPMPYRAFLLNYPAELAAARRIYNDGLVGDGPSERECNADAGRIISENQMVREPGTPWTNEEDESWPDRYVVIGDDQCGNYFAVDRESNDDAVWLYDHDVGEFAGVSEYLQLDSRRVTLAEFAAHFIERRAATPDQLSAVARRLPLLQAALTALDAIPGDDLKPQQLAEVNRLAGEVYRPPLDEMWQNFSGVGKAEGITTGAYLRRHVRRVLAKYVQAASELLAG